MSLSGIGKAAGKTVGKVAARDLSNFVNPQAGSSVIGKALLVASELNALAQGAPLPPEGPLEDNRDENLVEAQLRLEFAFAERLSHNLAYKDITQQQTIVPVLEADNIIRHYEISKLSSGHGGIVGNILIPHSNPEQRRVYVNFRGTDPSILATLHLDLEHNAGEESFHHHFAQILAQINEVIGQVSGTEEKPVELIISGYSLGGALAQYCYNMSMLISALHLKADLEKEEVDILTQCSITEAQEALSQYLTQQYKIDTLKISPEDYKHFARVNSLQINTWGSSGVSKTVEDCSNHLANILLSNGKDIIGRFGENVLDLVAKTGDAKILSCCGGDLAHMKVKDENLDVKRSFLSGCISGLADTILIGGPIGMLVGGMTLFSKTLSPVSSAHTNFNFGSMGEKLAGKKYKTFLNKTLCEKNKDNEKGKEKEDDNFRPEHEALTVLQNPMIVKAKDALRKVGDVGASVKQTACETIVGQLSRLYRPK